MEEEKRRRGIASFACSNAEFINFIFLFFIWFSKLHLIDQTSFIASFELMRKEQHKVLQEKQKITLEKQPTDSVSDISTLPDDKKLEKKALDRNNEPDVASGGSILSIDSGKPALPSHTTTTVRPLVPPGFTNMPQEKNSGPKSLVHSQSTEVQLYLSTAL